MSIILRPKQERVIGEARIKLRSTKRLLIQAPCGFGKTVVGSYIVKNARDKGRRVYFLTHRDELARQASRTLKGFDIEHGFIMAAFTPAYYLPVQVAMIDTLRNRLDKVLVPDVLIVDECHHGVSKSWQNVISYFHERGAVVIGLSATPQRLDGRPLNDIFEDMVLGPSVRELIDDGNLSDFTYYAPPQVADLAGLKMKYGEFDQKEMAERMDRPQVFGDAIEHYQKILPGKRAIAFHVNIEGSRHFAEQCRQAGIPALHVDGEMCPKERAAAVQSFERGETLILSNVSLFGEGFDIASCDGVILLRRTASLSLFIQMCGRALRVAHGKTRAVILDHVGNLQLHGLPDAEHDWSLEGKTKRGKKKKDDDPGVELMQCPKCYVVSEPAPVCPNCGHVFPRTTRGEMEQVDGELQEITPEMRAALAERQRREQGNARTVEEMVAKLGYSLGRAEKIVAARREKEELRNALILDLQQWRAETGQTPLALFDVAIADIKTFKPKALKELRARFDAHRALYRTANPELVAGEQY